METLFIFLAFVPGFASAGETVKVMTLRAHHWDQTVWQVKLSWGDKDAACQIAQIPQIPTTSGSGKSAKEQKLDKTECLKLAGFYQRMTKSELGEPAKAAAPGAKSVSITMDEPLYEISAVGKRIAVEFQAPEECAPQKNGDLECEKNLLSAAQEILLMLRPYGKGS